MFEESLFNLVNIALAAAVMYFGMKVKGGARDKSVGMYVVVAAAVLGVAELVDLFQIFPDGTLLANLMYEKEIPVLLLLLMAVMKLREGKK